MKNLIITLPLTLFVISAILMPYYVIQAQIEEPEDSRNPVYICIFHENGTNLIKFLATEPLGLIFSENVNAIVYSSSDEPMIADVIHIEPDTTSGTYRRVGDVLRGAYTTSNIPSQGNCTGTDSEQLANLNRTILLPLSNDQALGIHPMNIEIDYENSESSLFIGAIGLLFRDTVAIPEDENPRVGNNFPHFQILRYNGGQNDQISIEFYGFGLDTRLYAVSQQVVSYTHTNSEGIESQSKFFENREFFLSRLEANDDELIQTILTPGDFRFYVGYGEEIIYRPGTLLNLSRLSSFEARVFEEGVTTVEPITCRFALPYFRVDDYTQYIYFTESPPIVGNIRCGNAIPVEKVFGNGILQVEGGYYIASWLVAPSSES